MLRQTCERKVAPTFLAEYLLGRFSQNGTRSRCLRRVCRLTGALSDQISANIATCGSQQAFLAAPVLKMSATPSVSTVGWYYHGSSVYRSARSFEATEIAPTRSRGGVVAGTEISCCLFDIRWSGFGPAKTAGLLTTRCPESVPAMVTCYISRLGSRARRFAGAVLWCPQCRAWRVDEES
jgi:hypothetical protein